MPHMEIKNRFTGDVIYSGEATCMRELLENAIKDNANLYGANLYGANLRGANLRGANLRGADLYGANLLGANLESANLRGANLRGANLRGADLYRANLCGADLYRANLESANLESANLLNDVQIVKIPIQVSTPVYPVIIFDGHMRIGCKFFALAEWWAFDDRQILELDGKRALEFWREWKAPLQAICAAEKRG